LRPAEAGDIPSMKRKRKDDQREPQEPRKLEKLPPDEANVRAKSSGHGKKTADKWNQ
jgi:hypothetical protein